MAIAEEREVGATTERDRCCLEIAHRRIEIDGKHIAKVRRRRHRQTITCEVGVVTAGDDSQFALFAIGQPVLAIDHECQFSECHAMHDRYRQPPYSRLELHIKNRPINIEPVRIGAVKNDDGFRTICTGSHKSDHGDIISVETQTYILNINDEYVELLHRLGRRSIGAFVVKREDRHARFLVNRTGDMVACTCCATESMLGREDSGDVYTVTDQDIKRMFIVNNTGMIGEECDTFVLKEGQIVGSLLSTDLHSGRASRQQRTGNSEY